MAVFKIEDMTCGHCAGVIIRAVQSLDEAAKLEIDLAAATVRIASQMSAQELAAVIKAAGYTPALLENQ